MTVNIHRSKITQMLNTSQVIYPSLMLTKVNEIFYLAICSLQSRLKIGLFNFVAVTDLAEWTKYSHRVLDHQCHKWWFSNLMLGNDPDHHDSSSDLSGKHNLFKLVLHENKIT